MKALNVLMILSLMILSCLFIVGYTPSDDSSTEKCDLCGYGDEVTHYTYNYLQYECIYCDSEWLQFYNAEANSASKCYTYLSSSTMSGLCIDHTTCSICYRFAYQTHYDYYYAKHDCWDRSSMFCWLTQFVFLRSEVNSGRSCKRIDEDWGDIRCDPCVNLFIYQQE